MKNSNFTVISKKIFLLVLVATSTFVAHPANSQQEGPVIFGEYDCTQWLTERDVSKKNLQKIWLMGFISGLNTVNPNRNTDPLSKLKSANQAVLWMDIYCSKNPLDSIYKGGITLFLELKNKQ
jgi:hypothetical protein